MRLQALILLLALPLAAGATLISHHMDLRLDPVLHTVEGSDTLGFAGPVAELEFMLHEALEPAAAGRLTLGEREDEDSALNTWLLRLDKPADQVLIRWRGELHQDVSATTFSREKVGGEIRATVGEEGVYLSGGQAWYPLLDAGLIAHRASVTLPEGWSSLTQGRLIHESAEGGWTRMTWDAPRPSDGINMVANRWQIDRVMHGETVVQTNFFPEDAHLAQTYLDECLRYMDIYEELLGPYPYAKFAVVENFFPTGYGMPSWTLLGQQVLRLPFIVKTSLGHELAHNWWGNSVFVGEGGNWCEGITVYCADYLYKKLESPQAARSYRKNLLKDYSRYVVGDRDFPLTEFLSRHDSATRAVGYGKSMMVFHMLQEKVGQEAFEASLRRVVREHQWSEATWSDFFRAAEAEAGLPGGALEPLRVQWVERVGAPLLFLDNVEDRGETVAFTLRQEGGVWDLDVPVNIQHMHDSCLRCDIRTVRLDEPEKRFELPKQDMPGYLEVDPDFNVFRRLHEEEMEATLSLVLSDEAPLFVLEPGLEPALEEAFRAFAGTWVEGEPRVIIGDDPAAREEARTVIWLGKQPPPFREAPAGLQTTPFFTVFQGRRLEPGRSTVIYTGKRGAGRGFMAVLTGSAEELGAIARKVPHYGKYSYLAFEDGQNQAKGNWETGKSPLSRSW